MNIEQDAPAFTTPLVGFLSFGLVLAACVVQLHIEIQSDIHQRRHQLHGGQRARVSEGTHLRAGWGAVHYVPFLYKLIYNNKTQSYYPVT